MAVLKRILSEPLLHFLVLALAIFGIYAALNPASSERTGQIVVTNGRVEQLAERFARTWQRAPSPTELKALIDEFVKEEVYYREALALGLDKDDTLIRRRLRLKLEFLIEAEADSRVPTDEQLSAYMLANPRRFEIDPKVAFRQVFFDPARRGNKIHQDIASALEALRTTPDMDLAETGDATLLPGEFPLTDTANIGHSFGSGFSDAIAKAPAGTWLGPISSAYGLHLVQVTERSAASTPPLGDIRSVVIREWTNARRKEIEDARFNLLLSRYQVRIDPPKQAEERR